MSASINDLIPLVNPSPALLFAPGGLNDLLVRLEAGARALVADVATSRGRDVIRANAAKVARAKTYLDDMGKSYVAELKALPAQVDAERRAMRLRLDALRDEVRQPLTEFELAEARRLAKHRADILAIADLVADLDDLPPRTIACRIDLAVEAGLREGWEEFALEAAATVGRVLRELRAGLVLAEQAAARLAEEERQRAAIEATERLAREARIASEAAAKARQAAEEQASREREELEREHQANVRNLEALANQARLREAEAEQARLAAERRSVLAAEEERVRLEARLLAEGQERLAREKDRGHRALIDRRAAEALATQIRSFQEAGLGEADVLAHEIVARIVIGAVPGVSINY